MLAVLSPGEEKFKDFKCGEVYYVNPSIYNVNCCICGNRLSLSEFPQHFQDLHLNIDNEAAKDILEVKTSIEEKALPQIEQIDMTCDTDRSDDSYKKEESEEEVPIEFVDGWELPIEFMEVRLPKLKGNRANNFIPEQVIMDYGSNPNSNTDCPESLEISCDNTTQYQRFRRVVLANERKIKTENRKGDKKVLDANNQMSLEVKKSMNVRLQCKLCRRSYKSNSGVQHHMRVAHEEPSESTDNKTQPKFKSDKDEPMSFQCNICGKSFSCLGNLNTHKKRHSGVKSHKCPDCGKVFYTDHEMQSHLMIHSDMLPVICEICGRRFRNTGKLKAHMRRHTGERPAKCEVCNKCFFSNHDLNVHRVTHTTERPFSCEICGSTFRTKKALRVHKKLHMPKREYQCELCNKAFVQSSGLYSHMSQVHMKSYTFKFVT